MPKISELLSVTRLTGTEQLPVVQSGVTKKATVGDLFENQLDVVSVFNFMTEAQIANVQAGTGNVATDRACIQNAFNSLAEGQTLYIPRGTYKLGTGYLDFRGKANIQVIGAGMGATILDGSSRVFDAYPEDGTVLCGQTVAGSFISNQLFKGFTVKGESPSGTTSTGHLVTHRRCHNITFDGIELYNGGREVLYNDGGSTGIENLVVRNCYFHDNFAQLCSCINTNSNGQQSGVLIESNRFESSTNGMYLVGKNIRVVNNYFKNMVEGCVNLGESNNNAAASLQSALVANNLIEGFGTTYPGASYNPSSRNAITSNARSYPYVDGTSDGGVVIANNVIKNSACETGTVTRLIRVTAGAIVIGNYASGCTGTGTSMMLSASFSSDVNSFVGVNSTPVRLCFRDNVLEKKSSGNNIQYGMFVLSVDNAYLDCSGNRLEGGTGGAQFETASNGFLPKISLCGDVILPTMRLYDLLGTDFNYSSTEPIALYGTNRTTFRSITAPDRAAVVPSAARNLGGSATPDLSKGGVWFYCSQTGPVTITNFVNAPVDMMEITIWFNDANTTIQHGANIKLNGSVNFVSSQYASITLCRPNHIANGTWVEKCRSKP